MARGRAEEGRREQWLESNGGDTRSCTSSRRHTLGKVKVEGATTRWRKQGEGTRLRGANTTQRVAGGVSPIARGATPRGIETPQIYERDGALYAVAFGLRLKRTRESVAVTPAYANVGWRTVRQTAARET